jgi:hydrogenase maturation protein HypF
MGARLVRVRGVVQGVGFRPFVYRLARAYGLNGWVLNGEDGVEIQVEGTEASIDEFLSNLRSNRPPASEISCLRFQAANQ